MLHHTKAVVITTATAAAAALVFLFMAGGPSDIRNTPIKEGPIVAFGDSLVEGVGSTSGHDLVSILSRRIGRDIINLGNSGDTTEAALARIGRALDLKPSVAIVLLGGNDFLRRVRPEETFANLAKIIDALQREGAAVLLLGVRGGLLSDQYDDRFAELAERTRSAYVPDVLDGLLGDQRYMSDAVHPNDRGYAIMADRVSSALEDLIER